MADMLRMMCAITAPIPRSCRNFSVPGLSSEIATSCVIDVGDELAILQLSSSTISTKMRLLHVSQHVSQCIRRNGKHMMYYSSVVIAICFLGLDYTPQSLVKAHRMSCGLMVALNVLALGGMHGSIIYGLWFMVKGLGFRVKDRGREALLVP